MANKNHILNSNFESNVEFMTEGAVNCVNGNSYNGNRCIHFTHSNAGGSHFLYYDKWLVPGKTYTLSFYIKMIGTTPNVEPAVKYKDAAGNYQMVYGGHRTAGSSYGRQEFQFTIPANSPSTFVTIYVYSNIYDSSQQVWLDQLELWGEDSPMPASGSGNINDQMIVTMNFADARSSANPSASSLFFMWTGDICTIKDQTVGSDGLKWFKVKHGAQPEGWVRADYLGIVTDVASWGRVTNNPANVQILEQASSSSRLLGTWHNPAMLKITGETGQYYKLLWVKGSYPNGSDAYVRKAEVVTMTPYGNFEKRMAQMAVSFKDQIGITLFDNISSGWCQSFLNIMAVSAGLTFPAGKLPPNNPPMSASNTWHVLQWLRTSGYVSEASNPIINGVLTNGQIPKAKEPPKIGDWVYLLSKRDAQLSTPLNTSHVEMVVEIDPYNPYRVKLCGGDVISGPNQIVKVRDWIDLQNMNPQNPDDYYYVAHGHPFWQMP